MLDSLALVKRKIRHYCNIVSDNFLLCYNKLSSYVTNSDSLLAITYCASYGASVNFLISKVMFLIFI